MIISRSNKQVFGFTTIVLLIIFLSVAQASSNARKYSLNSKHINTLPTSSVTNLVSSPIPSPSPDHITESMIFNTTEDSQSSLYSNYKHYANSQANFTIEYPNYLTRTELYPKGMDGVGTYPSKRVYFCENPLDINKLDFSRGQTFCDGGGIAIEYNGDGWGGGCDEVNHHTLTLMNKEVGYCSYPTSFSQLYYGSPRGKENNPKYNQNKFMIHGIYSTRLSPVEVENILLTFKVIDP